MSELFKSIKAEIEASGRILITGHKNPDGDCIGSALALGLVIANNYKEKVVNLYIKELPGEFEILRGKEMFTSDIDENYDLVIAVDAADGDRIEVKKQFEKAKSTVNIDHHINNPNFAAFNYVDEKASSTCEIMFEFITTLGYEIDKSIAEALYVGIISDTGMFQNKNTTVKTFSVVTELMKYNINFNYIIKNVFYSKTFSEMKLIGKAIENAEVILEGEVIISTLSLEEINKVKARPNETSNIINMLRQVANTKIAVFIYEPIPNNIKISLRSDEPYNVYEIASNLGGGGHILAAGVIVKGNMEEKKKEVIGLIKSQIDELRG